MLLQAKRKALPTPLGEEEDNPMMTNNFYVNRAGVAAAMSDLITIIVYNNNRDADIPMNPDDEQSKELVWQQLDEDAQLNQLLLADNAEEDFLQVGL